MSAEAHFYLLIDAQKAQSDFMAECLLCGAITMQTLPAAWAARKVTCSNCGVHMPLDSSVLDVLRQQALNAQAAIDQLAR
jgi:hypothetical protein